MKDNEIISLFELRDEHAIEALSDKYHPYPSIDAQSAQISITKVQLGYMCMSDSEGSDTEAVLIPVWDFYGTWTSKEPEYEYGNGEDGLVMGDVTMDDTGVPLLIWIMQECLRKIVMIIYIWQSWNFRKI